MFVYVVYSNYSDYNNSVLGIYSTEDKAKQKIKNEEDDGESAYIIKWEVDNENNCSIIW